MFGLGTQELIIILAVGGLLFGAKKLPELGRGLGEAIRGFKKSVSEPEEKAITNQQSSEDSQKEQQ
jgi:sec-independent protein translocase protein TatA